MITGNLGRRGTGVNPLRGQNNVQGACDMGGLPNVYPAYQVVTDAGVKKKFEERVAGEESLRQSRIYHHGDDARPRRRFCQRYGGPRRKSVGSDPDVAHVKHALKSAEFLAVIDIFLTDTARLAHVVLPGAAFAEKDGTFSNTERNVLMVRKAVDRPDRLGPIGKSYAIYPRGSGFP